MEEIKKKYPEIPKRIAGLKELSYNFWWSWRPEARVLFKMLGQSSMEIKYP